MFDYQKPYSSYIVPIISTENPEWIEGFAHIWDHWEGA
jgi:hypothetical protein